MPLIKSNETGSLPKWWYFRTYGPAHGAAAFGFKDLESVYRLAARFRAANCFNVVLFDSLSPLVAGGYTSLTRFLFAFSALEFLVSALGPPHTAGNLLQSRAASIQAALLAADPNKRIFQFVLPHSRGRCKREVAHFLAGRPSDLYQLVASIRHSFAHGYMTPSSAQRSPVVVSDLLREDLLQVIADEFLVRVGSFRQKTGL